MTDVPGAHLSEEPQEERGAPGSRDTGSDGPGGGPVDRPAGTAEGQTTVDSQEPVEDDMPDVGAGEPSGSGSSGDLGGTGELPPQDTGNVVPPYEGRRESADVDTSGGDSDRDGASVGGATGPVVDDEMKSPEPSGTPRGAAASPAEAGAADEPEGGPPPEERSVGPSHSAGTTRAEDKS